MAGYPLVIVNGRPNSGKDTFISLLINILENGYGIKSLHLSSIDIIKDAAELLGWDGSKDSKSREFLSRLKELSIWYNDYPFTKIIEFYDYYSSTSVVFTQVRESTEIMKLKARLGVKCITVLLRSNRGLLYNNVSDFYCEEGNYDMVVKNDGSIDDLAKYCSDVFLPYLFTVSCSLSKGI